MNAVLGNQVHLRPNTNDGAIWEAVYKTNEYRLPERLDGWRVIDIGAHIGSFARLCLDRGAMAVESWEPDAENMGQYSKNLSGYMGWGLNWGAVWSESGWQTLVQCPIVSEKSGHTLVLHHGGGAAVPAFTLAEVLGGKPAQWCKIDAEGAEYGIIGAADEATVRLVQNYVIESHMPLQHGELIEAMRRCGFFLVWRETHLGTQDMALLAFHRKDAA